MTPHVKYVSICVQREITLNSGKEISAPQIIQGREFTTRDITRFTYQVMCWREFTISRLFFFFLSFLIIFSLSFPLISLPCFWFFDFFSPPPEGGGNAKIYSPVSQSFLIYLDHVIGDLYTIRWKRSVNFWPTHWLIAVTHSIVRELSLLSMTLYDYAIL